MTPRDLRNIHTNRNSCRDALPCANMALKLPYTKIEEVYFKYTSELDNVKLKLQDLRCLHNDKFFIISLHAFQKQVQRKYNSLINS